MAPVNVRVYGYTSYNRPASPLLIILSVFVDFCILFGVYGIILSLLKISPIPKISVVFVLLGVSAAYWLLQRFAFGVTLGERAWWIRNQKNPDHWFHGIPYQCDYFSPKLMFSSCLVSTLAILITSATLYQTVFKHPVWLKANYWEVDSVAVKQPDTWLTAPYYYGLSKWPQKFEENPVYYTLPYESGPPSHFVGRIQANLEAPDIKLIIEGPKTPSKWASQKTIRDCFLNSFSYHCLGVREETLFRHVKELDGLAPQSWSLKWFVVNAPQLSLDEFTQGLYLRASGANWIQDRFILISPKGSHQTLILKRPMNAKGEKAFELVKSSIQSLRILNDLDTARTWADQELLNLKVDSLVGAKDPTELLKNFVKVQGLLLSKISVDPANFDSYFHLAGTSALMLRRLTTLSPDKLQGTYRSPEILAAIQNIDSAYRFSKDIAPKDQRLPQLQSLWLESKKWK